MSRNVFEKTDESETNTSLDCISIKASSDNLEEGLLRLLTTIAVKVTGGPDSDQGQSVKAALSSLHLMVKLDKEAYEKAVMFLSMNASALIPDDKIANLGEMPEELRKMRDDIKETILEAKKEAAERALKNNPNQ